MSPIPAIAGTNDETTGGGTNVNPAMVAVPPGVVTVTFPEAPLVPTLTVIVVEFTMVRDVPEIPPNRTDVAPKKFVPVIVTVAPPGASVGVKEVIVGVGYQLKPALLAVPPNVVT